MEKAYRHGLVSIGKSNLREEHLQESGTGKEGEESPESEPPSKIHQHFLNLGSRQPVPISSSNQQAAAEESTDASVEEDRAADRFMGCLGVILPPTATASAPARPLRSGQETSALAIQQGFLEELLNSETLLGIDSHSLDGEHKKDEGDSKLASYEESNEFLDILLDRAEAPASRSGSSSKLLHLEQGHGSLNPHSTEQVAELDDGQTEDLEQLLNRLENEGWAVEREVDGPDSSLISAAQPANGQESPSRDQQSNDGDTVLREILSSQATQAGSATDVPDKSRDSQQNGASLACGLYVSEQSNVWNLDHLLDDLQSEIEGGLEESESRQENGVSTHQQQPSETLLSEHPSISWQAHEDEIDLDHLLGLSPSDVAQTSAERQLEELESGKLPSIARIEMMLLFMQYSIMKNVKSGSPEPDMKAGQGRHYRCPSTDSPNLDRSPTAECIGSSLLFLSSFTPNARSACLASVRPCMTDAIHGMANGGMT